MKLAKKVSPTLPKKSSGRSMKTMSAGSLAAPLADGSVEASLKAKVAAKAVRSALTQKAESVLSLTANAERTERTTATEKKNRLKSRTKR